MKCKSIKANGAADYYAFKKRLKNLKHSELIAVDENGVQMGYISRKD